MCPIFLRAFIFLPALRVVIVLASLSAFIFYVPLFFKMFPIFDVPYMSSSFL